MKYFTHDCDAGDREWLNRLHDKFGHEGYSLWFQILEVLGQEIEKEIECFRLAKSDKISPIMTIGTQWLTKRCKTSAATLKTFTAFCKKARKYSVARFNTRTNTVTIEIPKFLQRMDEYARKVINKACRERGIYPDSVLTVSGHRRDNVSLKERKGEEKKGDEKGGREARPDKPAHAPPASPSAETAVAGACAPAPIDEVAVTVEAFAFCSSPREESKRAAIQDLLRMGRSHNWIRHAAGLPESKTRAFFEIIRDIEHKKLLPPLPTSPPTPKPEGPTREEFIDKMDKAREEADRKLHELPPEEVAGWRREAEREAEEKGYPATARPLFIQASLRLRAAERFKIDGLTAQKEMA